METIVYQIEFLDGRIFRIFCANSTQKRNVINSYKNIEHLCKEIKVITNGLHTAKQWGEMIENL